MPAAPKAGQVCTGFRSWIALLGWVFLTFLAPAVGATSLPDAWYASLNKPSWNPPGWVFGPVWTALYLLMATAAWLVWRRGGFKNHGSALGLYGIQLLFNAAWSPLFFTLHRPLAAFADIALLWIAIVATLRAFVKIHAPAAFLLLPYLLWVTFAAALNWTLFQLNR